MVLTLNIHPYTPGAGMTPSYVAGREELVKQATDILARIAYGYPARSIVYYGLRGVGKTVLLNEIKAIAEDHNMYSEHIEVSEKGSFKAGISLYVNKVLRNMSNVEAVKQYAARALDIAAAFRVCYDKDGEVSIGVDANNLNGAGISDTGNLQNDLTELFVNLGKVGKKLKKGAVFFVDEAQYIKEDELEALMAALHRCNQLGLPVAIFFAGLPKITKIMGKVKSYAERLFLFVHVDKLSPNGARLALINPAKDLNVSYSNSALDEILDKTECYPYFLQEYGGQVWDLLNGSNTINKDLVLEAYDKFISSLDESFFRVRIDRASEMELEFMKAMVKCGSLPCQTNNVARFMGRVYNQVAPMRGQLMSKGLIYDTGRGEIDFTVPHFDKYLQRTYGI